MDVLRNLGIPYINVIICSSNDELPEPSKIGSYEKNDVTFLLKDISNIMEEKGTKERERLIQSGTHYSEMLPVEYKPTKEYIDLFHISLKESAKRLAIAVGVVAEKILSNRGKDTVLVSLARAGTPVGILIKRYIEYKYDLSLPHYSISIIRGKGIDENAVKYMLKEHPDKNIQFVDGWTGKGAITKVLSKACAEFEEKYGIHLNNDLAVLADPGHCVSTYGTREDFLIASACLNSTVSGLVSRTVHRKDLIGPRDFHGAKYYKELENEDVSKLFIETIVKEFKEVKDLIAMGSNEVEESIPTWAGLKDIKTIQEAFKIEDINLIKPGIGETTRVLLRRIPWKILVKDRKNPNLKHILLLAEDKNVSVEIYQDMTYECCGIIKPLKEKNNDICK
nr:cysteine protease StiP family protein [Crassaminicella profunda]